MNLYFNSRNIWMNWLLLKNHPKQNMICCFFIKITKFKMRLTRFFGLRATYDILARRLHFVAITLNFDVKTIYLWRNRETATHNIINLKILCHVLISFLRTNQNWLLRLNIKKKIKRYSLGYEHLGLWCLFLGL